TSRNRLHLAGEVVFPLEPLPAESEALELFEMRARAQQPEFALTPDNRQIVRDIVRLLDGLPLAIELAAARIRVLSPARLHEPLRGRFAGVARANGASARQSTLRRAIDWSWDLLSPWEQAAFAQCSAFDGGFTLEAAGGVHYLCACQEGPPSMAQ